MSRIIKNLVTFSITLALFSCVSVPVEQVDSRIGAWNGKHIDEIIKYWGLPSNQKQVGDKHYAEWINHSSEPGNASVSIGTGSHSRHSSVGIGFTLFDLGGSDDACSRLVTYSGSGNVTAISWQGTRDFCYEITPDLAVIESKTKG